MATIVESVIGDRRISIGAESFARKMVWGGDWTKLRIIFRISSSDSGANVTNAGLMVGCSSGATNGYDSGSLAEFIGCYMGGGYLQPYEGVGWTRGTYSTVLAYSLAGMRTLHKAGSTVTLGTSNSANTGYATMASTGYVSAMWLTITRQVGSFYMYAGGWDLASGTNVSMNNFNLAAENGSEGFWNGTWGDGTLTYAGNGVFDSLMIRWNKSNPTLELSNLRVMRYY